jgi:spore maturation protein CgeB
VLERSPAIAAAALWATDLAQPLSSGKLKIVVGDLPVGDLPETIGTADHILVKPYVTRYFSDLYPDTADAGTGISGSKVAKTVPREVPGTAPRAVPRTSRERRLLFFQSGYYLDPELRRASGALGYAQESWGIEDFRDLEKDREADFRRLLEIIKSFRPDMAITINHLGFDRDGVMASILSRLGIPAASWFVDSPWYILKGATLNPYPGLTAFSWDCDYLGILKDLGFPQAHYLPLATDGGNLDAKAKSAFKRDIAFVGDSLEAATQKYLALAGLDASVLPRLDAIAKKFLESKEILPDGLLSEDPEFKRLPQGNFVGLSALVTWRASRIIRTGVLAAMPEKALSVAGDPAWEGLLPGAALLGQLDYYTELSAFYRESRVNLNVTSAQMKGGMNQRVFDVPAAGGFLLTDRRRQLFDIFTAGRDVACYDGPEEAAELAAFYLKNDSAREGIVKNARELIETGHMYRHRLPVIVERTLGG